MRQLFKRRNNAIARLSLIFIFIGLPFGSLAFWTALKWSSWQTEVNVTYEQPVPFSHRHHVAGLGIDCRYCHTSVETTATAGMPSTHTCMTCHSQIWQNAAILAPVRESYSQGSPLEWNRIYRLPKYVYFNHSIHIQKGVQCTSCHGDLSNMPLVRKEHPFYMRDCLACHRETEKQLRTHPEARQAPFVSLTDCYVCHR